MAHYRRGRGSLFYQPRHKQELLREFWEWNRNLYIMCDPNGALSVKLMDGAFDAAGLLDPCEIVLWSGDVLYHEMLPPCPTRETLIHDVFEPLDLWVRERSLECPPPVKLTEPMSADEFRAWLDAFCPDEGPRAIG